jgi:protein involved in polysaccharide export with SLBB domain
MRLRFLSFAVAVGAAGLALSRLDAQSSRPALGDRDRVLVKLWMDSTFADTARIHDGAVVLPRLGAVSIRNLPANLVADSLRRAYASVFRSVVAEVTPLIRVTLSGELRRPSVYFLDIDTSMRDAIAMAGGVSDIGRASPILLLRQGRTTRISGGSGNAQFDTPLNSGDVVIVDREAWYKRNAATILSATGLLISVISLTR